MKVLFCVLPERGHVNPYIGPAERLVAEGVEVAFWAAHPLPELPFPLVGEQVLPPPGEVKRGAAFAACVRDPDWLRGWIRALLVDAVESQIEPLRRVVREFDVVALDPMLYAAALACERERVPWAALSNSLNPCLPDDLDSELLRTVRWLSPARAALFARHGVEARFRGCDLLSPRLTVAFTTEALVGPVKGVQLVGPSLPRGRRGDERPFPWGALFGAPLVYLSLGSQLYHQPALVRRVIDAVAGREVQLVIAAAELELSPLPENVIIVPYAPQLAILKGARAFITHGGANSVMEALAFGVPLLLSPLCNDQFHQLHFVERAGVGRRLPEGDPWPAIAELLEGGLPRLREVTASYQVDGAAECARLVSALA